MANKALVSDSRLLEYSWIPEKWWLKQWEDFTNDERAVDKVSLYLDKLFSPIQHDPEFRSVGLFLYGANGTGKTLLATLALRHAITYRVKVKYISMPELVSLHVDKWRTEEATSQYGRLMESDIVLIDDIGKEKRKSGDTNDLALNVVDTLLRARAQGLKCTWFTSNITPEQVKTCYSEDFASLLREVCYPILVGGSDYRIKIANRISKTMESND
jgi:DNA replication protein DnaC